LALPPGTRLGVYEVLSKLGEGGMGEVYRATDTKLKRQVAIKILPPALAADHDRLARFQREAEVLASLNHPHIAGIHGLEESPSTGSGQAGITALVMELVEGDDLSQRIARGAIPIDEALPIAKQIAEALEAAHEQGIVHRDLKPANIKVRADGTVKVLDFGLAKAMDPAGTSSGNAMNSPTLTSPATQFGVILGTAAYMAPEQAKGKSVDKRADIWAFGVVTYEMLTGRRLFDAEDISETLAAVLTRDLSMATLPAAIPARLRALLRDCLTRDPRQRLRDIGDARIVLDKIIAGTSDDAVAPLPVSATQSMSAAARALPWAVAATFAVVAGAVLMLWTPWRVVKPADRPLVRLDLDMGADVAFPSANNLAGSNIAISPDGTRLVYGSGTPPRLFTRRLDQPKATELPGTQGAMFPFFSPDGQWVGFGANGKVNKISVEGGAMVPLGEAGLSGASWAEDGSIFVSEAFGKGLLQFPAAGGAPTIVAPLGNGEVALAVPQLLPGGKAILFAADPGIGSSADAKTIEVLTLADGHRKVLARGGHSPHYLPSSNGTGHLVYLNRATLFAIPFDPATLETRGTAVPVLDDVASAAATGAGLFDVSRTGTLIYRRSSGGAAVTTTVQWVSSSDGATGKKEPLRATPGAYQDLSLSPDGKRIALVILEGANRDVWVYDPQRDAITRLTFGGANVFPVWSPDGQYVVFAKLNEGIFQARADGASQPQALTGSKTLQVPSSFTPDGKRLAYMELVGGARAQISTVTLEDQGGQLKAGTPEPFLKSNFSDQNPAFSPDGRWLAYHSNESGRLEVYVRAFPPPSSGQGGKWQISNNGGGDPRWSRGGHELVYRSGNQLMTISYAVNGTSFVAEKPRVWIAALGGTEWDLAADGKRVAVVIPEGTAQAPQQEHGIVMLLNFADELRRRVPIGK
jgi:Protein kinase domain/WD40-like Beta Propeller Repeat